MAKRRTRTDLIETVAFLLPSVSMDVVTGGEMNGFAPHYARIRPLRSLFAAISGEENPMYLINSLRPTQPYVCAVPCSSSRFIDKCCVVGALGTLIITLHATKWSTVLPVSRLRVEFLALPVCQQYSKTSLQLSFCHFTEMSIII